MPHSISTENRDKELDVQNQLNACLNDFVSFCFDAGAGAGKTYALHKSIEYILKKEGGNLKLRNQKVLCITYTNAAKNELISRIGINSSVLVSTIHEFLWGFISNQQALLTVQHKQKIENEIRNLENQLNENPYLKLITDYKDDLIDENFVKTFNASYNKTAAEFKEVIKGQNPIFEPYLKNVGKFKSLVRSFNKKISLKNALEDIKSKKQKIVYSPTQNRDRLEKYIISHDTLLDYCENIITEQKLLKRLFTDRYPYVLVDEYQDTSPSVITILDSLREFTASKKNFVVGFFGDSLQNIYESGVGKIPNQEGKYKPIKKTFNRRSSTVVIETIEKIRNDGFGQETIYDNFNDGSSKFYLENSGFNLESFLRENNLSSNTACLLMKNDAIANQRGFSNILETLKSFPRFSGGNYQNINTEFLQKNLLYIGWFLRQILNLIDFIRKVEDGSSMLREITEFIDLPKRSSLTFNSIKPLIKIVRESSLSSLSLGECIERISEIKGSIEGNSILANIFALESKVTDPLAHVKNSAYDYFYFSSKSEGSEIEQELSKIDKFFDFKISEFSKWHQYVYGDASEEGISYYTLHGSKGLEFDNVVVVLEDNFAKRKDYCKYFFEKYSNLDDSNEADEKFVEVRNLLYVAYSRAKLNLYVIYKCDNHSDVREGVEKIFGEIEALNSMPEG